MGFISLLHLLKALEIEADKLDFPDFPELFIAIELYEALGVGAAASDEDLAEAYREATQELTFFYSADAALRLQALTEAYRILSIRETRTAYDEFLLGLYGCPAFLLQPQRTESG